MDTIDLLKIAESDFNEFENSIADNPTLITMKDSNDRHLIHWLDFYVIVVLRFWLYKNMNEKCFRCALKGRERSVEHLLSFSSCPIDSIDDTHNTPLILATLKGNLKIVESLIKAGANVNAKNQQGHSSLQVIGSEFLSSDTLLTKWKYFSINVVQYACSKGWTDIVQHLLQINADVNVKDIRGDTPLHRLASMGRVEILKIYLTNATVKPILDCPNREGNTPLHYACEDDESSCALLLIEHGASPLVLNKEEKTPLDLCKPVLRRVIKEKCGIEWIWFWGKLNFFCY